MSDAVPIPERIYNNTVRRLREQELEIASLVEEIDRCNRSMAEMAKMYPVVDAARKIATGGAFPLEVAMRDPLLWKRYMDDLQDAVRTLDGEP